MFSRPMLFCGVLLAAVVVPYVLLDDHVAETSRGLWGQVTGNSGNHDLSAVWHKFSETTAAAPAAITGPPPVPIEQAFRFDLTPQFVAARWARVSTVLGDPNQLGMRVALITGTRPDDVAGSLTYYFDQHHQLQRITFTGLTADPRRLLTTVVTPNGLKSQPTTAAARYIAGDPQKPTSEVIVRHLPVMHTDQTQAQMEVAIDLGRTGALTSSAKAAPQPDRKQLRPDYWRW